MFDTPGLADGTGNEEEYLRKIKEKVTEFDVLIFCTEMTTRRIRSDDINTIKKLTEAFGSQLWEHAVVALTFANEVHPPRSEEGISPQEYFEERIRIFKKNFQVVIGNAGVGEEVVITIPFVATGDLSEPTLPGITNWMTAFWIATFKRLNRNAKAPFLLANIDRLYVSSCDQKVPRRVSSLRRNLPPAEFAERNQPRRQMNRRSFQGFELEDREHISGHNSDSDDESKNHRLKSHSMPRRRSRVPPKTKPKPKRSGKGQDVPAIDMDETAAKEVLMEVVCEVGKEASTLVGDLIKPGSGRVVGAIFSWIMKLIKRWLWNDSVKENDYAKVEDELKQEED